jgi:NADH-quinone oxidoreductase subunit F
MEKIKTPQEFKDFQKKIKEAINPDKSCIVVCGSSGCLAYGTQKLIDGFNEEIEKNNLKDVVDVRVCGCLGFCERGPIVLINPAQTFYQRVGLNDAAEIVEKTVMNGEIIERLLFTDPETGEKIVREQDVGFYKKQERHISGINQKISQTSIDDYISQDGYSAFIKVLTQMKPEEVIE